MTVGETTPPEKSPSEESEEESDEDEPDDEEPPEEPDEELVEVELSEELAVDEVEPTAEVAAVLDEELPTVVFLPVVVPGILFSFSPFGVVFRSGTALSGTAGKVSAS